MNISDPFKKEVFRPIATLVLPGATAVAPYALLVWSRETQVSKFVTSREALTFVILLGLAAAVGFILEDLGAWVKVKWGQKLSMTTAGKSDERWETFLQTRFTTEYVGFHYLQTILHRMKFELAYGLALIVSLPGWVWFGLTETGWRIWVLGMVIGLLLVTSAYLLHESWSSTQLLDEIRKDLLKSLTANDQGTGNGSKHVRCGVMGGYASVSALRVAADAAT